MNTLFFWITIIQTYIYASNGQYVNIWEDNMDTNNNLWTGYNQFDFGMSSPRCQLNTCARVTATNGNSWIQRTTNISLYHSIELQIDITGYDLETGVGDSCQIFYNYDNNEWIKLGDWGNDKYKNQIINFPQSFTANANILWIRLQINGDSNRGEDRCYWDNIILKGIPFTLNPSNVPTNNPSVFPTQNPTQTPSNHPSFTPTQNPTQTPSNNPSNNPTINSSNNPSFAPTQIPTINPSNNPSFVPTQIPSFNPSKTPSNNPSFIPTQNPFSNPTIIPSLNPSQTPSNIPSSNPSNNPSNKPTLNPSSNPSTISTNNPSISPTQSPFKTNNPSFIPTLTPSFHTPINNPTNVPTYISKSPTLIRNIFTTNNPSFNPTKYPFKIKTFNPTNKPTQNPSITPTKIQIMPNPTAFPSEMPSFSPTPEPTHKPSKILETTRYDIFNVSTNTTLELIVSVINSFNTIDLQSDIKDLYLDNKTGQFDDITFPMALAVFIGGVTLCSVVIVISKRICIKTKNKNPPVTEMNKSTALSNTDGVFINGHNIQNDTCDIISPLQLSKSENFNTYHSQIHSKQQSVQQKSTHTVQLTNIHSNVPKSTHMNSDQHVNMKTISDSGIEDTPMEKPHHHIYPTITSVNSFGLNSLQHAVENAKTSSQFDKVEHMLSKLEQKAMEQNIRQNNYHSYDMSSTDTSIYFTTETSVDTAANKFITQFNTIRNQNINNKYTETHF